MTGMQLRHTLRESHGVSNISERKLVNVVRSLEEEKVPIRDEARLLTDEDKRLKTKQHEGVS